MVYMIRTILVDDEELSITSFKNKLQEFPEICIVKTYTDPKEVLIDLESETFDVAFENNNITIFKVE